MKKFSFKILNGDLDIKELLAIMVVGALVWLSVSMEDPSLIKDFALLIGGFYFGTKKGYHDAEIDEK